MAGVFCGRSSYGYLILMLERPTPAYIRSRLPELSDYADTDAAIHLAFSTWPRNDQLDQVLTKVVVLNRLYSTSIYDVHGMARHIVTLNIDAALMAGDPLLVARIAVLKLNDGRSRNNYSFATKYCAWHEPERFQIYDARVDAALWAYQRQFKFGDFRRCELLDYSRFTQIVDAFINHFQLHNIGRKQLDKFLWLEGGKITSRPPTTGAPTPQRERLDAQPSSP